MRGQDVPSFITKKRRFVLEEKLIESIVNQKLKGTDQYLVGLEIKPINKISIFVDSDTQVTIDDCVEISRYIESRLDRDREDFDLSVSSAGLDHPFRVLRQYKKNIGREIEVVTYDGIKRTGKLVEVNDEGIKIEVRPKKKGKKISSESQVFELLFKDVKQAKSVITF